MVVKFAYPVPFTNNTIQFSVDETLTHFNGNVEQGEKAFFARVVSFPYLQYTSIPSYCRTIKIRNIRFMTFVPYHAMRNKPFDYLTNSFMISSGYKTLANGEKVSVSISFVSIPLRRSGCFTGGADALQAGRNMSKVIRTVSEHAKAHSIGTVS